METPSADYKHQQAIEDRSHLVIDTWATLFRNVVISVVVAITVWGFSSILLLSVDRSTTWLFHFFNDPATKHYGPWILISVLILGGIIRDIILRFPLWHDAEGDGVASSLKYFYHADKQQLKGHSDENKDRYSKPTFMAAIRRMVLTFLTIGTGGSGGLEGPVIPIGEAIGAGWSRYFKVLSANDLRVFQMAGISAAFATLLNAPFMAAIFAAEIVFLDRIIYRYLFYSLIAAIIAYYLNNHFLYIQPLFTFHPHTRFYSPQEYLYATLVAVFISAPVALGLKYLFLKLKKTILIVPTTARATVGACMTGIVALGMWFIFHISPEHILGVGESTLRAVYEGTGDAQLHIWWVLLLIVFAKALTTGFTLMAGGSAGLLIPAMFMGGISGAIIYHLLVAIGFPPPILSPEIFIVAGVASSLVAVIEVPLAAIAFVLEGFGAAFGPPAIAACIVCHLVAKRLQLYVIK